MLSCYRIYAIILLQGNIKGLLNYGDIYVTRAPTRQGSTMKEAWIVQWHTYTGVLISP